MITLPENAKVLPPLEIYGPDDMLLSITAVGRMLMFPVADLPELSKGKGNKIVSIPAAQAAAGEDRLAWLFVLPPQTSITLHLVNVNSRYGLKICKNSVLSEVVKVRHYHVVYNALIGLMSMHRHGQ